MSSTPTPDSEPDTEPDSPLFVPDHEPLRKDKLFPGNGKGKRLGQSAGRRRRGSRRQNSWLSHVKQTMKMHKGKSFKQILQLAKKSYHNRQSQSRSQSQSQSQSNQNGGKRRRQKSRRNSRQNGGSGAKRGFSVADNAAPY